VVNAFALAIALAVAAYVPALQPGDTVPAIPLVDQSGRAFSIAQLRGDVVVLSFIYTRCADPQMCPLVSSKFERIQNMLGTAPVRLLEITLDPQFDTPRVLRAYGHAYGAQPDRWTLATGAPASINELAARMGIATQWTRPGTLVHTEAAIVLDREGRLVQTIDGNAWTPDQLLASAREAAGAEPSPPLARVMLWLTAAVESCGGSRGAVNAWEMLTILLLVIGGIATVLFRAVRSTR
jgi:cytochrome oxidase Cu insertion factor (SCO1/SenC/PrrC family)